MRFRPEDLPSGTPGPDDPFAEFPSESTAAAEAPKAQDWLAEFPDEKTAAQAERSKTWRLLSESVKDEKGGS